MKQMLGGILHASGVEAPAGNRFCAQWRTKCISGCIPPRRSWASSLAFRQPQADYWIHWLTPILNAALGDEMQLPARQPADLEEVLQACPELQFILDGTERPIQRPKDSQRRKDYYSGRKKQYTAKNVVITHKPSGRILGLSRTYPGRRHDKAVADEESFFFPPGSHLWEDTGFEGYAPEGVMVHCPKKKPRKSELSPEEKAQNRAIAQERIGVEHSIGKVKIFRIVRETYRNHRSEFEDLVMETACGLCNLLLACRPAKVAQIVTA
ncbi:HARBI1 family protein [Thermoflexus hugenholtzii]